MIRFVARKLKDGKLTIGLVLLPEDIATLLGGLPERTRCKDLDAENPIVEDVVVFAFRDLREFQESMSAAGLELRMVADEMVPEGETQRFLAPPMSKIKDN